MKRVVWIVASAVLTGVFTMTLVAQDRTPPPKPFTFRKFSVPGAVVLGVESINNTGSIAGYYMDAAGNYKAFIRSASRVLITFTDPGDIQRISFTQPYQINGEGVVTGQFSNSATNNHSGFFNNARAQTCTTANHG